MSTGKWRQAGVPHKGWVYAGEVEDLGQGEENHVTCEMCEAASIRYVHPLAHLEYPDVLHCGCVCAEHMTGDYVRPRALEKAARSHASKRKTWCEGRGWRISAKGNEWRRKGPYRVVIVPVNRGWAYYLHKSFPDDTPLGRIYGSVVERAMSMLSGFPTPEAAKAAAFDMIQRSGP